MAYADTQGLGAEVGTGILGGAASGLATGATVGGPIGAVAGTAIGMLVGAVGSKYRFQKQQEAEAAREQAMKNAQQEEAKLMKAQQGAQQLAAKGGAPGQYGFDESEQIIISGAAPSSTSGYDQWHQQVYGP